MDIFNGDPQVSHCKHSYSSATNALSYFYTKE